MGLLADMTAKIKEWWHDYKKDVAIARERQRMLRLIRDKSYAQEKGRQDAKTEGHRAREPPREYSNSLFSSMLSTAEPKDAIGTIEPIDPIGKIGDMFGEEDES